MGANGLQRRELNVGVNEGKRRGGMVDLVYYMYVKNLFQSIYVSFQF